MPVFAIEQQLQQNLEPTTAVLRSNSDYLSTSQPQLWGSPVFPSWMIHNMLARFPGHNAKWWCGTPDRLGRSQDGVYQLVAPSWLLTACFPSHDRFDTGKQGADGQICKGSNSVPGAVFRLNTQHLTLVPGAGEQTQAISLVSDSELNPFSGVNRRPVFSKTGQTWWWYCKTQAQKLWPDTVHL